MNDRHILNSHLPALSCSEMVVIFRCFFPIRDHNIGGQIPNIKYWGGLSSVEELAILPSFAVH